ncbi:hypothetical protein HZB00_02355 [Candidatus Woesearchaeota archaeon]|nr:hypothetical protein [Candidatus Woesearchaeota archaeon]
MQKRGQVTLFVFLGLVVLILISLFFYVRSQYGFFVPSQDFLSSKASDIQQDLEYCVETEVSPLVKEFSLQGGNLHPTSFVLYHDSPVSFLCRKTNHGTCVNYLTPLGGMLTNLQNSLDQKLNACVNKKLLSEQGFSITGNKNVQSLVQLQGNSISVVSTYDVQLHRDTASMRISPVRKTIADAPLGELYPVVHDILEKEATAGTFDQLFYMLQKKGKYLIEVDRPYPHTIYRVYKKDSTYEFWFAVEGKA